MAQYTLQQGRGSVRALTETLADHVRSATTEGVSASKMTCIVSGVSSVV